MTRAHWLFWVYLTIAGGIVGWGIQKAQIQIHSDAPPDQWEREKSPVPYRQSALQGTQEPNAGEWGVDFYRAVYPRKLDVPLTELHLNARIPAEGFLEIWLSTPPIQKRMGDRWMNVCTMQTPIGMQPDPRCAGSTEMGIGLVLSRLSNHAMASLITESKRGREEIQCVIPTLELNDQTMVHIQKLTRGWKFTVDDASWTCDITIAQSVPMLRSGLRQVLLSDVSINSIPYAHTSPNALIWVSFGAILSLAIGAIERKLQLSYRAIILTSLPMILGLFWQEIDGKVLIEDLRASWMNPYWIATYLSVLPLPFLKLFALSLQKDHPRSHSAMGAMLISILILAAWLVPAGWLGILCSAACLVPIYGILKRWCIEHRIDNIVAWWWLCSLLMIFVTPFHWAGIFWAGLFGISLGTIINANRFTVPHFNWWSLGLFIVCTFSAEVSLRSTKAGLQWSNKGSQTEHNEIFGWVRQANESFELFEEGKHTSYPDKGYPVAIPQKSTTRIVSFGGSTTGGAFQNDNLNEFYPALLNQILPTTSVLNQGVGGWTTWHIREYFERVHGNLNADAITLYVGHNDILTSVPLPYKELYPLWQQQRGEKRIGGWLNQIRLYQALRYIIISIRKAEMKLAVPVPHAKENLLSIIEQAGDIDIYLGSEGLSPDPGILYPYNDMMKDLANTYTNVHYVPIAEVLSQYAPHQVFLDDCHLTAFGHQIVAKQFQQAIENNRSTP